jgi:hypothetical protein
MYRIFWVVMMGLLVCNSVFAAGIEEPAVMMDEVVVTATRMAEPLSRVSASVAVVTAEEIAARGATRLDEVLQDVVGLHVVSSGSAGSLSSASIRGSEASQVLVLIDGVRLNSPQNGQFDLNQLRSNGSKSCVGRLRHFMAPTLWAGSSISSPVPLKRNHRLKLDGPRVAMRRVSSMVQPPAKSEISGTASAQGIRNRTATERIQISINTRSMECLVTLRLKM